MLTSFSLPGSVRFLLDGEEGVHSGLERRDPILQKVLNYSLSRKLMSAQDLDGHDAVHLFRLHLWSRTTEATGQRRLPGIMKIGLLRLSEVEPPLGPRAEGILSIMVGNS